MSLEKCPTHDNLNKRFINKRWILLSQGTTITAQAEAAYRTLRA